MADCNENENDDDRKEDENYLLSLPANLESNSNYANKCQLMQSRAVVVVGSVLLAVLESTLMAIAKQSTELARALHLGGSSSGALIYKYHQHHLLMRLLLLPTQQKRHKLEVVNSTVYCL